MVCKYNIVWDCLFGIYNFTTVILNEVLYYPYKCILK